MRDQRADALARILVQHSARVGKGDVCVIEAENAAEALVQAVYEEVLRAGGFPVVNLTMEGQAPAFYKLASEEQLDWMPPPARWVVEEADVRIRIMADANTRAVGRRSRSPDASPARAKAPDGEDDDPHRGR